MGGASYLGAAAALFPFQLGSSICLVNSRKLQMRWVEENLPVSSMFSVRVLGHHETAFMRVPRTAPGVDPPSCMILHLSSSGNRVPRTTMLGRNGPGLMHFSRIPFRMKVRPSSEMIVIDAKSWNTTESCSVARFPSQKDSTGFRVHPAQALYSITFNPRTADSHSATSFPWCWIKKGWLGDTSPSTWSPLTSVVDHGAYGHLSDGTASVLSLLGDGLVA